MDEHKGGPHSYYSRKVGIFVEFIDSNSILDMNFIGVNLTWCNNQLGLPRRCTWLDRCLVNFLWSANFDCCILKHLPHTFSDHAPILLFDSPYNYCKSKIFHFNYYCLEYIGCHTAIKEAWNFFPHSSLMYVLPIFLIELGLSL